MASNLLKAIVKAVRIDQNFPYSAQTNKLAEQGRKHCMKNKFLGFYSFYSIALLALFLGTIGSVSAQVRPYRVTDRQVQTLLNRIETRTDTFRRQMNTALDRSPINNTDSEDSIADYLTNFENATDTLRENFEARRSVKNDVSEVLNRATFIDQFMKNNRLTVTAQNQWRTLQNDLNTLATYYSVSWNWNNYPTNPNTPNNPSTGAVPYRVSDSTVSSLLSRIETRTDAYRRSIEDAIDRGYLNNSRSEETFKTYVTDFENSTDELKRNFSSRRSTTNDVQQVLNRAYYIDGFMRDYKFTSTSESQWNLLRTDLNTLSNYYNVSWNWNSPTFPTNTNTNYGLTGTYRLNTSQSDNVSSIVNNSVTTGQRENARRNLERRLSSPDMIAIDKRNRAVTIASTLSPQVTFQADGVARTETTANGRSIRVTASESYDGLTISTEGDRINDFYVSFMPMNNGQLRVVRRVYLENRNETITVSSIYDKTDNTAQWSMVGNGNGTIGGNNGNNGTSNDFYIPNGTRLTAVLQNAVNTKDSQNGDRITLLVNSPSQYDGAVIEGRVANTEKSGRVSGRATVSMEFDTIRLRNGQAYRFAGFIDSVKAANGDNVSVNNEGTVRDNNQTTKTVTRAGIGAALGAIIGAIAGGGQGAAIGAAVGAGAGAGTVILQGRDNIELGQGSEFSITASAPANVGSR
jgi:hypothetical protein